MPTSISDFMKRLEESGLMSVDDISTFHESIPLEKRPKDAQGFARELVKQNNLTKLQAAAVYQGKTKNLIFGEYIVLEKIGAGGMGQVFSVKHRHKGGIYALKVLSSDAIKNPKIIQRFHREARASSKLDHPNIVRTIEAGKVNQVSYLVMEYAPGDTLRSHIKQNGPLSLNKAVHCLYQSALGLGYAHKMGIIHRDVSPNNFIIDQTGFVKILDMGLARMEEEEDDPEAGRLTNPGQMLGTVQFMSPEHVEDARIVDARSDIYSLGCTFHYFLAGRGPYKGETPAHTLLAHIREPIPSLRVKRPDVPEELDTIFQKMLAKNPDERYQSVFELLSDLHQSGFVDELPPEELRPQPAGSTESDSPEPIADSTAEQEIPEMAANSNAVETGEQPIANLQIEKTSTVTSQVAKTPLLRRKSTKLLLLGGGAIAVLAIVVVAGMAISGWF